MQRCPNCSYKLVLLEKRAKYKCALCSGLYPQKEIENKDFREWNKQQEIQDVTNLKTQKKLETKQIRDIKKALRHLFNGIPKSYTKKYINKKSREYRENHKEYDLKRKKEYREKNKEVVNLRCKIRNHRVRQKQIALRFLEENENNILRPKYMDTTCTSLLWEE